MFLSYKIKYGRDQALNDRHPYLKDIQPTNHYTIASKGRFECVHPINLKFKSFSDKGKVHSISERSD